MSNDQATNQPRRRFVLLFPLAVFGGILTSIAAAGFRLLRPRITAPGNENWTDVAYVSELGGHEPVAIRIKTERFSGWALTNEELQVYVLPARDNQILSAICPHEGCEVAWEKDTNRFSCPCHESYFGPDGSRLTGPARRGMDQLSSRVQNGKLQVMYQAFENNAAEPIKKA